MSSSPNIRTVQVGQKRIHILGTAHVSRASVIEVRELISELKPDAVCVELCQARYSALSDEDRWRQLDIFKVFREGKALFLLAHLAMAAYQRRIGQELGVKPGAELLEAVAAARDVGAEVVLADRDINVTLKRTWASLSWWKRSKVLAGIIASVFEGGKARPKKESASSQVIDEATIEGLKDQANISEMMGELAKALPEVKRPLIDERDAYLISNAREAPGETVVAVVGAGHVGGMVSLADAEIDRAELDELPRPKWWSHIWKWLIPAVLVGTFFLGLSNTEGQAFGDMIKAWVLPTALFSAVATLLVWGRWQSVLAALLCSPITTIHPLIASGMIVGPIEAWARKPTVEDADNIHRDVQSLRGFFKNPFTRTLIVAVAATIGSAIGAWVGLSWVISIAS